MSVAENLFDNAAQVSWDDQARTMLMVAADPGGTRERLDQLVAAMSQHDERLALAERSANAADEKHRGADQALAEVVDLQRRVEAANKSLRDRELAIAANEQAHRDAVAALADRETELGKRENVLNAAVRSLRQYLNSIEVVS
jgi:hypothetical protein